jgi:hypothetical protein
MARISVAVPSASDTRLAVRSSLVEKAMRISTRRLPVGGVNILIMMNLFQLME